MLLPTHTEIVISALRAACAPNEVHHYCTRHAMGTRAPRNGHGVPHLGILLAHAARDGHCVVRAVHLRGVCVV